jgi:uncharacterized protein YegP (UPF0339 family)
MITIRKTKPLHPDFKPEFYFTVSARNGQVLVTSETYKRRAGCKNAITSLRKSIGGEVKDDTIVKPRKVWKK